MKRKLKVLLLTGSNPFINAGIWATDIKRSLEDAGHEVALLTKLYDGRLDGNMSSLYNKQISLLYKLGLKIKKKLGVTRKSNSKFYMHSLNEIKNVFSIRKLKKKIPQEIDVIIYLFPHGFLNFKTLYKIQEYLHAPLCIIPADMAQMTGGCHYSNDCVGYLNSCGKCPGLYSDNPLDTTYKNLLYKKHYLEKMNVYTISNTWLSERLNQSNLFKHVPNYIGHVVVDDKCFNIGDVNKARDNFNLPYDKKIIFFGAANVSEERKGFLYLVKALKLLYEELERSERDKVILVVAGQLKEDINHLFCFETKVVNHLGHTDLAKVFQAADLFVSPSVQDAGPMMVIQSLLCGTPVIAFETGNSVDFIKNGETGFSVENMDIYGLKNAIKKMIQLPIPATNEIRCKCRKIALAKSSYESFSNDFITAYNNYLELKQCN